ncbi:MAG: YHS domain-containing protein [Bacteroidetes bacterium]|nr:YHS domain-containing protein [Bacteroidota bacterium]
MRKIAFIILLATVSLAAMAQKPEIFSTSAGAIRGYDAVTYFTDSVPQKGKPEFVVDYKNAKWYFASAKNAELFKADPEKYAPQFGGYCAFGMSRGYKAETQPDAWTIVDGKLYLNYNVKVRGEWNKKQAELITKAAANWVQVKSQ